MAQARKLDIQVEERELATFLGTWVTKKCGSQISRFALFYEQEFLRLFFEKLRKNKLLMFLQMGYRLDMKP